MVFSSSIHYISFKTRQVYSLVPWYARQNKVFVENFWYLVAFE